MKKFKVLTLSLFCISLFCSTCVYGYTVDDIRDMLGKERIDSIYTQEEIDTIIQEYERIEAENRQYELFEGVDTSGENAALKQQQEELQNKLDTAKSELANSFQGGVALPEVLKKKSALESVITEIEGLGDFKYNFDIEYAANTWADEYAKVMGVVDSLNSQYDLGELGQGMRLPVEEGFYLAYPFGLRLDWVENDEVGMHNGIDFSVPVGTNVYAQWNGTVVDIYENEYKGKTIEIAHGPDLTTVYGRLSEIYVNVGDWVPQYTLIGKSGDTGFCGTTEPCMHFEMWMDGDFVNPIYVYGKEGLRALRTFISNNPDLEFDINDVEANIKEHPDQKKETPEPTEEVVSELDTRFSKKEFFENIAEYQKQLDEWQNKYKVGNETVE